MFHARQQNRLRSLREESGLTLEQISRSALRLARFYNLSVEKIWQALHEQICQTVAPAPDSSTDFT